MSEYVTTGGIIPEYGVRDGNSRAFAVKPSSVTGGIVTSYGAVHERKHRGIDGNAAACTMAGQFAKGTVIVDDGIERYMSFKSSSTIHH